MKFEIFKNIFLAFWPKIATTVNVFLAISVSAYFVNNFSSSSDMISFLDSSSTHPNQHNLHDGALDALPKNSACHLQCARSHHQSQYHPYNYIFSYAIFMTLQARFMSFLFEIRADEKSEITR